MALSHDLKMIPDVDNKKKGSLAPDIGNKNSTLATTVDNKGSMLTTTLPILAKKDHKSDFSKGQGPQCSSLFSMPVTKMGKPATDIIDPALNTIVFGHHPCPDGIAAIVCLTEKFGKKNASYHGLNHAKLEDMRSTIFSIIGTQSANIIFADIAPPFEILKELLEKTNCTITLLDHHATAKLEIDAKAEFLNKFIYSKPQRLQIELDLSRSGAGIAFDYATGKEYPIYISLVQTIDLLTATANPDVIKQFDIKKINIDSKSQKLLHSLGALSKNDQIDSHVEFYVFAAIFDLQMKKIFKDCNNQMNNKLMTSVEMYFNMIKKNGLASLLEFTVSDTNETNKTIETLFREQLEYQKNAISKAKIIPSLIDEKIDVLFIEADIQTGRTFDPLIAEKLATFTRPTIAMIANTKNISDSNNWVALRAADNTVNLYDLASQYKAKKLAANAGGHARASALQLSHAQLSVFLEMAADVKKVVTCSIR